MSSLFQTVRFRPWAIVAIVVAALLSIGATSAGDTSESSEIEGVWSFEHGQVDIVPIPGGKFEGIVTVATTFASCPHSVAEHMWTAITPQPDGSYYGLHQWFHGNCSPNTTLGPTAWRVLHEPNGSRYLRVCFSNPGTSQPTIAANGAPREPSEYAQYHVTYGCISSSLTSALPIAPGAGSGASGPVEHLTVPSAKQCLKAGPFKIRLKEQKYDPFKKVTVTLAGHRVATSRRGGYVVATINLSKLSKSTFTVKIRATTVLGHHLSSNRTYQICGKIKPKQQRRKEKRGKGKKG
jgi:hypothetical protein